MKQAYVVFLQLPSCSRHSLTLAAVIYPLVLCFAVRKPKFEIGCLLIKWYRTKKKKKKIIPPHQSTMGKPEAEISHLQSPRKPETNFLCEITCFYFISFSVSVSKSSKHMLLFSSSRSLSAYD